MSLTIIYQDVFKEHQPSAGHPERPERVEAIVAALRSAPFAQQLQWQEARQATDHELQRCHTPGYIELAKREIQSGRGTLSTGDTEISAGSLRAALRAAGAGCVAVDTVMRQEASRAFCVVRPPGHHATPDRGMGFCVFNNIAVAARYAQAVHGLDRVLIADWDVHHGNGTQDIFYEDASVFFFSTHQSPWYPGTGAAEETGRGPGEGTTLNCPLAAGAGRAEIEAAFRGRLLPAMEHFRPDLVMISAGFDSRRGDPLGQFLLSDNDFADLTRLMIELAERYAKGRLISMLEGGYHLAGLANAATAHAQALLGNG